MRVNGDNQQKPAPLAPARPRRIFLSPRTCKEMSIFRNAVPLPGTAKVCTRPARSRTSSFSLSCRSRQYPIRDSRFRESPLQVRICFPDVEETGLTTCSYAPIRDGPAAQGWNASYSGSTVYVPGNAGVGTPFRHTENNGASFEIQFEGTAWWFCLSANDGATFDFTSNGHTLQTSGLRADSTCSQWPEAKTILGTGNLTYESYTIGVNVTLPTDEASFDFYGAVLQISAGATGTEESIPVTIDDTDPGWNYQPWPWLPANNSQDYNGTHSYACTYDPTVTATYTFNETTALQLIGSPDDNTFGYSISFEGVESVYNATNLWHADKQVLYVAGGLDPSTTYKLTLSNYDSNQPNGPGIPGGVVCTNLDALVLMKVASATSGAPGSATTSPPSPPGSTDSSGSSSGGGQVGSSTASLSSGAIAGVAIGGIAGVAIVILLLWLLLRRRAKQVSSMEPAPFPPMEEATDLASPAVGLPGTPFTPASGKAARSGYFYRPQPAETQPELTSTLSYPQSPPQSPPLAATFSDATSGRSAPSRSTASDPPVSPAMLQNAATIDLVHVLNQRLRADAMEGSEAPPGYQDDR
ncbi:hypothetical protein CALCODRAFT_135575 [Calocera cornea HHB12733]|uniref:Uncharacterized protein n=1 Tax=Calocera cornea HHB12733 TaxID=1353952 RepID=A0A165CV65_9BASI|nr:hypothetical protein CALCODRAFT_135575 [Calocera cornea HHB12733]